jgi:hypothetical protein
MKSSALTLSHSILMKFRTQMTLRDALTTGITTNTLKSIQRIRTGAVSLISTVKPFPRRLKSSTQSSTKRAAEKMTRKRNECIQ